MNLIPYLVLTGFFFAFLIPLLGRMKNRLSPAIAFFSQCLTFVFVSSIALDAIRHKTLIFTMQEMPRQMSVSLVVDGLSAFLLVSMNLIILLVALYSSGYMKKFNDSWKFYSLFLVMASGFNGVLIAGDMFTLYLFLEVASVAGCFLVAFGRGADEFEASFKYAVMGSFASIFILLGIAFLYGAFGTLNMAELARITSMGKMTDTLRFVSVLFLMGFGLKGALIPFHAWLPYAHSAAPAPISAALSGVSIKVLGIYALARVFFNIIGMDASLCAVFMTLGVLSMIVASILAFGQSDIKRLFAYSSISQIGYIVLGLGVATPLAIMGAIFYLFNHSVFKSLLFLNSGSIERISQTRSLNNIRGILSKSPWVGITTLVGAFSISGIPPFGGFWAKLIIIFACVKAGHPMLALIAALTGILTIGYYSSALTPALFGRDKSAARDVAPVSGNVAFSMILPVVVLAILSLASVLLFIPNAGHALLNDASIVLVKGRELIGALR